MGTGQGRPETKGRRIANGCRGCEDHAGIGFGNGHAVPNGHLGTGKPENIGRVSEHGLDRSARPPSPFLQIVSQAIYDGRTLSHVVAVPLPRCPFGTVRIERLTKDANGRHVLGNDSAVLGESQEPVLSENPIIFHPE